MIGATPPAGDTTKYYLGRKSYELSNHLGNVLATISDKKIATDNNNDRVIDGFVADLRSSNDYYPFGSPMQGRQFSVGSYRYGYQKQEKDAEVWGGAVSFKYRMEDTRLGRFFSCDPLSRKYPHNSPYAFSENRVIDGVELEGLEVILIGWGGAANVVGGVTGEAGVAIGPDGVYKYGSVGFAGVTNVSASTYLSITFYPDMPTVQDASGVGYSVGTSVGEVYCFGVNTSVSGSPGNYAGINFQVGIGAGVLPVEAQGSYGNTWLSGELRKTDAMFQIARAQAFISEKIKSNNEEVSALKVRNENLMKENLKLNKQLENSTNDEQSQFLDSQIDKNNAEYHKNKEKSNTLQKESGKLKDLSKKLDEVEIK